MVTATEGCSKSQGKGQLRTYWLRGVDTEDSLPSADEEAEVMDEKYCDGMV